jgi:nitrite reductase (NO-forming)
MEDLDPSVEHILQTLRTENGLAFMRMRGEISGPKNPTLTVKQYEIVKITLVNGDGIEHDLQIQGLDVHTKHVKNKGEQTSVTFKAEKLGEFSYFCSVQGHRRAGMEGRLIVIGES